jgi:gluconolactonase
MAAMSEIETRPITDGLRFPEGPVALGDTVVLVELQRGALSQVDVASGAITLVADCGGAPNGAAVGPPGPNGERYVYVANNGGYFDWHESPGVVIPEARPDDHAGGSIQRVDLDTGAVETLYDSCDGARLVAPNDLVFDDAGGFWFTDHGVDGGRHTERPGLLYATADGSSIRGVAWGLEGSNGVGLSPAGDRVYVAETHHGRVYEWTVTAPGQVGGADGERNGARLLFDAPEGHLFDSLAVDGEGWVCVATIGQGGVTAIAPDGSASEHLALDDFLVTNICFSDRTPDGEDDPERRTAYITCSSSGRLVAARWPRPGLALAH